MDHCLSLALPKPGSTPGGVLNHCIKTIEKLYAEKKPITFKIGFTHDAAVRWHNSVFGYKGSKDPFDYMIVLYGAANPHGPAFLEAALINHFGSFLFASTCLTVLKLVFLISPSLVCTILCVCARTCPKRGDLFSSPGQGIRVWSYCSHSRYWNLGLQGCKNERRGGDTVKEVDNGPYLTYVVYKSWQRPSTQVRSTGRVDSQNFMWYVMCWIHAKICKLLDGRWHEGHTSFLA